MNSDSRSRTRYGLALLLMLVSGFAALSYQIVWTQQSAIWLGHETASVFAVVGAFFGGLGLGAWMLSARIDNSPSPGRWYAGCELVIGIWGIALVFLLSPFTSVLLNLLGPQPTAVWHWGVAFFGTFLLLLPATAAMGATLPAMERLLAQNRHDGVHLAWLYAANTFGAVFGVLLCAFTLVPVLGLTRTAMVCVVLNFLCALIALRLVEKSRDQTSSAIQPRKPMMLIALAITGLLGIGYEVMVVRVLSQVAENTVYTFALLLAVYLVGTALGAAAYGRWWSRLQERDRVRDRLLQCLALSCVIGTVCLAYADAIKAALLHGLGSGMTSALIAEALLAATAFLFPTILMGALFTHLTMSARAAGFGFGKALGVNTLGAAIAPAVFSLLLLIGVGPKFALLLIPIAYLALASRGAWSTPLQLAAATTAVVLALWIPSLAMIQLPQDGRLVSYQEGALASVSVIEDARGVMSLHINNRQQEGSSATRFADGRQALLPMLLHPAPQRALLLGVGTGVTASVAAEDKMLQVDAVELLPEVINASTYFIGNERNPRLNLLVADARRFIRASRDRYDLVIADNFHPARSGSASLYTVEHFRAVENRLADGGLFCQWLPLHQLDLPSLRSIVRSFVEAYPRAWAILATNSLDTPVVGLIALRGADHFDIERVRVRLDRIAIAKNPSEFAVTDELALLGNFIAGPNSLVHFAQNAPLNTDDHPVIAYRAPRITYEPQSLPRDRLTEMLKELRINPDELLAAPGKTPSDTDSARQLAAYWSARNKFIEAGRDVRPTADVERMLAQVRDPLISVLRVSPQFRPAYDPLLRMAIELANVNPPAARTLLVELQRIAPGRQEAGQYLRTLENDTRPN